MLFHGQSAPVKHHNGLDIVRQQQLQLAHTKFNETISMVQLTITVSTEARSFAVPVIGPTVENVDGARAIDALVEPGVGINGHRTAR